MAFQRKKPAAVGVKAPFPGFIEPALATSAEKVPSGERWTQGFHPARQRLDQALSQDRRRFMARLAVMAETSTRCAACHSRVGKGSQSCTKRKRKTYPPGRDGTGAPVSPSARPVPRI